MAVLTDTNILLRLLQPHHPHCRIAERALDIPRARNEMILRRDRPAGGAGPADSEGEGGEFSQAGGAVRRVTEVFQNIRNRQ